MRWPSRLLADSGLLRRRGAALALALFVELLLVALLLFFVPPLPGRKQGPSLNTFGVEASKGEESPDKKPAEKQQKKSAQQKAQAQAQTQPPPPVPQPVESPVPAGPPTFLKLSRNDYQQGDISKMPSRSADANASSNDSADAGGGGGRADDSPVVGKAPNGEPLYHAEWYRKPTNAELEFYRPRNGIKTGIGRLACRTAPRYRLVDCQIIGQSPAGSGFGNAALQSSWQFLMRPPRIGGKSIMGAWVFVDVYYETIEVVK